MTSIVFKVIFDLMVVTGIGTGLGFLSNVRNKSKGIENDEWEVE